MPIISYGIILPNGRFLPNGGDGHRKNALRFCEKYSNLNEKLESDSTLDPDEFLITAGCAITATYRGIRCLKVAKNNQNLLIHELIDQYKLEGFVIWSYWLINSDYKKTLDDIINKTKKMQLIKKGDR